MTTIIYNQSVISAFSQDNGVIIVITNLGKFYRVTLHYVDNHIEKHFEEIVGEEFPKTFTEVEDE